MRCDFYMSTLPYALHGSNKHITARAMGKLPHDLNGLGLLQLPFQKNKLSCDSLIRMQNAQIPDI